MCQSIGKFKSSLTKKACIFDQCFYEGLLKCSRPKHDQTSEFILEQSQDLSTFRPFIFSNESFNFRKFPFDFIFSVAWENHLMFL